jgi:hypothetical protein
MYSAVSGEVGIGVSSPTAKLDIDRSGSAAVLDVTHQGWSSGRIANFEWPNGATSNSDILQLEAGTTGADDCQFIECERGSVIEFAIDGDGYLDSNAGAEFNGVLTVTGDAQTVGAFTSSAASHSAEVLSGISTASGSYDARGVYGESIPTDGYGIGGEFLGGYRGVIAAVYPIVSGTYRGVHGVVASGSGSYVGNNYGVYGEATAGDYNYGVYGYAAGGNTNWAGYFHGATHVNGTFTAGTKLFRIDHPLDPENKYLQHSCVESDEMMNFYNGNVVLNERGEAWIEMPDWFEALNQDFRYQLTPMGAPGPNLYIAEEIAGGRFMIAGGEPGAKVSWQVTGVRHDAVALANRMSVEVEKPARESGKYLNPEAFGKPASMGVDYDESRDVMPVPSAQREPVERPHRDRNERE